MSFKADIQKLKERIWYMDASKLERVNAAYKKMDGEFWSDLADKYKTLEENYKKEPDFFSREALKFHHMNFYESLIRFTGYKEILESPEKYDEIVERIKEMLQTTEEEGNKFINEFFPIRKLEQLKL